MEINTIHKEFHSVLNNYISRRVNNKADAEDLLQEVFIKIHNSGPALSKSDSLKSWLFTLTRNTIIDYYRKHGKNKMILNEELLNKEGAGDSEFDTTKGLESCIHRFIDELPSEYRQIILDSEINGIKQKDLAEKYKLAYPSLRSRVQRGRARLKEMFLDCCKIELDRRGNVIKAVPKDRKC